MGEVLGIWVVYMGGGGIIFSTISMVIALRRHVVGIERIIVTLINIVKVQLFSSEQCSHS